MGDVPPISVECLPVKIFSRREIAHSTRGMLHTSTFRHVNGCAVLPLTVSQSLGSGSKSPQPSPGGVPDCDCDSDSGGDALLSLFNAARVMGPTFALSLAWADGGSWAQPDEFGKLGSSARTGMDGPGGGGSNHPDICVCQRDS